MNRLLFALTGWALVACQAAAPASPAPTTQSTTTPQETAASSPSPGVKLIAFVRGTTDGGQLEVVDETGGVPRPINSPDLEAPHWSPDGEWIAVAREEPDHSVHVSLIKADGSGYHELHPDPTLNLGTAVWTPDGGWLACEAWDPTDETRDGIYMVKVADGSGLVKIAPKGIPGSFSADGKRLVFGVEEGDGHRMAIVNRDGTGFAKLGTEDVDTVPSFMPDGTIYATTRDRMGFFDLDGTLLRTFGAPIGTINEASLSPDGKRFVFVHFAPPGDYAAIATINIDGTDLQIVVPAIQGEDALHSEQSTPDWQP
jgi:Tol biopolymer transport system component